MNFKTYLAIALTLPSLAFADGLQVLDAWVPVAPPGAKTHAAYVSLTNEGATDRALIGIAADGFGMAHLHENKMSDGVMSMAALAQIVIPAGETLRMEPGSIHIMLMMPKSPVKAGETVNLSLSFNDGEVLDVEALVKGRDEGS